MTVLDMDTIVEAASDVMCCDLAGDTALLHLKSGTYYTLNRVGTAVWNFIQEPRRVRDIQSFLLERYDVGPEPCAEDLVALLRELSAQNLIATCP